MIAILGSVQIFESNKLASLSSGSLYPLPCRRAADVPQDTGMDGWTLDVYAGRQTGSGTVDYLCTRTCSNTTCRGLVSCCWLSVLMLNWDIPCEIGKSLGETGKDM